MKKGKLGLALISAAAMVLILLAAAAALPAAAEGDVPLTVRAGGETVELWQGDGETFYAFLPAWGADARLEPRGDAMTLAGEPLPQSCSAFPAHTPLELQWQEQGQTRQVTLTLLPGEGTASLHIDTRSGSMDHIHGEKGNAEGGSLRLYDEAGALDHSGTLASLSGRGNSTWVVHDKKPYSLSLVEEGDLLGMGAGKNWVLLADALDSSGLRNKTVLDFAAKTGIGYTPQCRWTELYLNGEYAGLYLLCERIENDPRRLDLGYDGALVSMDRDIRVEEDRDPWFRTEAGQYLQIREGADIAALKTKFQTLEDALLAPGDDWQSRIHLGSWVNKYLLEELFGSYDAGFQSQYFYCYDLQPESPVYAGPMWDYDAALGNPGIWSLNSPQGLYAWRPEAMVGYPTPWYHSLYEKAGFRQALQDTWQAVYLPLLAQMPEVLETYTRQLDTAFSRNALRWAVETPGLAREAEAIGEYLQQRSVFLGDFFRGEKDFCILRLREGEYAGYYGYYALERGTCFDALPEKTGEDFLGWYREDTGEAFDPEAPVTEDLELYPRYAGSQPPAVREKGLRERLLEMYHYVPGAVLVLLGAGLVLVPVLRKKTPGGEPEKEKTPW